MFQVEEPLLALQPAGVAGRGTAGSDHAVAGTHDGNGFAPIAAPTARTAAGAPICRAMSP